MPAPAQVLENSDWAASAMLPHSAAISSWTSEASSPQIRPRSDGSLSWLQWKKSADRYKSIEGIGKLLPDGCKQASRGCGNHFDRKGKDSEEDGRLEGNHGEDSVYCFGDPIATGKNVENKCIRLVVLVIGISE